MDDVGGKPARVHKKRKAGGKVNKKKRKLDEEDEEKIDDPRKRNPKAFSFQAVNKTARLVHRALDAQTRKHTTPTVDRTPDIPPPTLVAVVGPPKSGKTTLIKSLIKHYTKQNVADVKGPLTVVTGKNRRCTFVECPNDISAMIDIAKVADLVLLLVDANFGFEMEIFEFLNITQAHGLPRIMGVLTHLDLLGGKGGKSLNKTKRTLKHRFWTEVHQGAKLFYLSSLSFDLYNKRDILNLARFISVMKFKVLSWRQTHPYIVVDRVEDLTPVDTVKRDSKCDRTVGLYGWVRGANLHPNTPVHICGVGDIAQCKDISILPDPCGAPEKSTKRRTLNDQERVIYGPMSGVGGLLYDKDATYIEATETKSTNETTDYLVDMEHADILMKDKIEQSGLNIFANSNSLTNTEFEKVERRKVTFDDEGELSEGDSDEDDDEGDEDDNEEDEDDNEEPDEEDYIVEGAAKWKEKAAKRATENFMTRQLDAVNLHSVIYGDAADSSGQFDGLFEHVQTSIDCTRHTFARSDDWTDSDYREGIRDCFVTGDWEQPEEGADFEDVEATAAQAEEEDEDKEDDEEEEGEGKFEAAVEKLDKKDKYHKKKERMKALFNADYDDAGGDETKHFNELVEEADTQTKLNKELFADEKNREEYEGFRAGLYVRVEVENIPCEMLEHLDPHHPLIVGGIGPLEQKMGLLQTRTKRHRWYPKVLKNQDPIIVSLGWRRFQTRPVYSIQDHNLRQRMLKYTPEHMHCHASFYGPLAPPNTSFIAIQGSTDKKTSTFRIVATGLVTGLDKTLDVVKKLKLTGTPYKIFKNTAFMKGMFSSLLEVGKFEGAMIKTVSGVRGQVKKALSKPEGAFRATFEDKIQMSDIVFLRCWVTVEIPRFYAPVTNLLAETKTWSGMRTVGELRRDKEIAIPVNKDSEYKPIERKEKVFKPLKVSKNLQKSLPFKTKPKLQTKRQKPTYLTKRAVVSEPGERRLTTLMQQLLTAHKETDKKKKVKRAKDRARYEAEKAIIDGKKDEKRKERRKTFYQKNQDRKDED